MIKVFEPSGIVAYEFRSLDVNRDVKSLEIRRGVSMRTTTYESKLRIVPKFPTFTISNPINIYNNVIRISLSQL